MTPELYFDGNCPICKSFTKLLRTKVSEEKLVFVPMGKDDADDAGEFQLKEAHQQTGGKAAIDRLVELFPETKEFFWMLPENYKVRAMKASFSFGKWLRSKLWGKKDCDCE